MKNVQWRDRKPPRKTPAKLQEWYSSLRESLGRKVEVGVKYEGKYSQKEV